MKTSVNARTDRNLATENSPRPLEARPHLPKSFEHRHERRKFREQLRRLNWIDSAEVEIFA